jgi:hypothetical protein
MKTNPAKNLLWFVSLSLIAIASGLIGWNYIAPYIVSTLISL